MRYQAPRGTEDVLPGVSHRWLALEGALREVSRSFGYQEIRTPIFEDTELFARTAGETSDIVTKEMYTFVDKGGRSITLRPEGTAPVMRSVIEHNLCPPGTVLRLSYLISFFRYGRPGRGRMRQAHQYGVELIGANGAAADAESIELASTMCKAAGLTEFEVVINSIGRAECRARYREAILVHVAAWLTDQNSEEREKVEKNPLGLLDSKDPSAQAALADVPSILDFLEPESAQRFSRVQEILAAANVPLRVDPKVVRGLDYYTETVFEGVSPHLEGLSLFGGGRYDHLIKELGGAPTPSVGFGLGIERLLLALENAKVEQPVVRPDVFVVQATSNAEDAGLALARAVRAAGFSVVTDPDGKSLKSQLRQADRLGARFALILGEDEMAKGMVQFRILDGSAQMEVGLDAVVEKLQEFR